jgi:Flp pilus assembly protein TadG
VRRRRAAAGERGSVAIELVGVIPLLVLVTMALVQGWLLVSAVEATTRAARDGARAEARQPGSGEAAARAQLPDWVSVADISRQGPDGSCTGVCTRVAVEIPLGIPGFIQAGSIGVVRAADFPRSDG